MVLMALLTVVVGLMGGNGMRLANSGLKTVYEDRVVPLGQLLEVQIRRLAIRATVNALIADPLPGHIQSGLGEIDADVAAINKSWTAYMASNLTPEEQQLAKGFVAARAEYAQIAIIPIVKDLRASNIDAARQILVEKNLRSTSTWRKPSRDSLACSRRSPSTYTNLQRRLWNPPDGP